MYLFLSFLKWLFGISNFENNQQRLWNSSFGEIIASLTVLDRAGLTSDMLKKLREKGGDTIAKKMVAIFTADHYQIKVNWYNFYKNYFGIDMDLSNLKIPAAKLGFTRCLIIIPGISLNMIIKKMKEYFKVWTYTDDLDKAITQNDREAKDEPYAIWVKDGLEPEKDYRNMSAEIIAKKNISGETLLERLIHGLEYYDKTKKHLDYKDITLCSGSRHSDGGVPRVCFRPGLDKVKVYWCNAGFSHDRAGLREVSF